MIDIQDLFTEIHSKIDDENKFANGLINPSKRKKKYLDKVLKMKWQLWYILSVNDMIYMGARINSLRKWRNEKELNSKFSSYTSELKEQITIPYLLELEAQWKIWQNIIDRWAGNNPLSYNLKSDHNSILIEKVVNDHTQNSNWTYINYDINKLTNEFDTFENINLLQKAWNKFDWKKADFMIFSEILNYGYTHKILKNTCALLKDWWWVLIVNEPNRGLSIQSNNRIKSNFKLIKILENCGYMIEEKRIILSKTISFWHIFCETTYYNHPYNDQGISDRQRKNELILIYATKK